MMFTNPNLSITNKPRTWSINYFQKKLLIDCIRCFVFIFVYLFCTITFFLISRENNAVQVKINKSNNKKDLIKYIIQKQDGSSLYISR
jgi:hypothetical protein